MTEREVPETSAEMLKILEFIFDPKNKHLFTVGTALEAFKHIEVKEIDDKTN